MPSCRANPPSSERSAGACRGLSDLAEVLADGASAGAPRRLGTRPSQRRIAVEAARREPGSHLGAAARGQHTGQPEIVRRLAARCDPARRAARGSRRLSIDRARQALYDHRHGDRPGQDLEHERARDRVAGSLERRSRRWASRPFARRTRPTTFGSLRRHLARRSVRSRAHHAHHAWAQAQGAVFENVGLWKRARYFPRAGEDMHAAVARECLAVRNACGIFDASTLGKIEVVGADAAEFMNRLYVNSWSGLAPGRARYGILLPRGRLHLRRRRGCAPRGGPLPRHHHHGRGAARARDDGGLPPDRMARSQGMAHLHHRAVGRDRGAGTERAARARAAGRRNRHQRGRPAPHGRCARQDRRRADAACFA